MNITIKSHYKKNIKNKENISKQFSQTYKNKTKKQKQKNSALVYALHDLS